MKEIYEGYHWGTSFQAYWQNWGTEITLLDIQSKLFINKHECEFFHNQKNCIKKYRITIEEIPED